MDGKIFIQTLILQNFLSYGGVGEKIELQPLNVLIGPNGSGKSNLIEALNILKATPVDLPTPFRQGGGINNFLWKGNKDTLFAYIGAKVNISYIRDLPKRFRDSPRISSLFYRLVVAPNDQRVHVEDEEILLINNSSDLTQEQKDHPERESIFPDYGGIGSIGFFNPEQSGLSQVKDMERYPGMFYLSSQFSKISLYRHWQMGRYSEPRNPQPADLPIHPLEENGSNLGLFLNNLKKQIGHRAIIENLKKFYDSADEINVDIYGNTVQIFIREENLEQPIIPATRLSDGTLRYLFLMALLLDPTPPPLICIEEPEIGLHPDILSTIAEMLIDASKRTQIILTTHSDALVSALSEYPECILVCERDQQGTHLRRLEPDKLKNWLENYTLGDLWRMGEIGGNRW